MKSLKTVVTESLIQPDEIGMPTDGLFRMIQAGQKRKKKDAKTDSTSENVE